MNEEVAAQGASLRTRVLGYDQGSRLTFYNLHMAWSREQDTTVAGEKGYSTGEERRIDSAAYVEYGDACPKR